MHELCHADLTRLGKICELCHTDPSGVCVCVCVFVHSITFLHTSDKQIDYDLPVDPTFCRCDNCVHELCHADLTRLENM